MNCSMRCEGSEMAIEKKVFQMAAARLALLPFFPVGEVPMSLVMGELERISRQIMMLDGKIDLQKNLRDKEVSDMRGEQRIAAATIASGTSKTARILERVTPDGDAISTRSAA